MTPPGEWAGLIAFVIACGVAVSLVLDIVIVAINGGEITGANGNLLSTLFGASIGVVGTYIGAHGRHGKRESDGAKYGRRADDNPSPEGGEQ